MILGPKKLLQLVKTKKLVEGLSERELINPEGAGFDLRLGEVYSISGKAFLGEIHRKTAEIELIKKYDPAFAKASSFANASADKPAGRQKSLKIKPGDFFLVKTIESVNMPANLTASITPRSTTYRCGLFLRTGNVPPGYCGGLIFGLKNEGPVTVEIEMGARFVHLIFHEIKGEGSKYRGQWQGGRVTTKKREKQV